MNINHTQNPGDISQSSSQKAAPLALLKEISLQRLQSNDDVEITKLLIACKEDGVFYLNLRDYGSQDGPLLSMSTEVFQLSKELFDLPLNEKMGYDIDNFGNMKVDGYVIESQPKNGHEN